MKIPSGFKQTIDNKASQLRCSNYMKYHDDFKEVVEHVFCKMCGTPIKGIKADPKRKYSYDGKDYMIGLLVDYPEYTEVEIKFEDGSAHTTPLCKTCASRLTTIDAECVYAADMLEWEKEDWVTNWEYYCNRIVVE